MLPLLIIIFMCPIPYTLQEASIHRKALEEELQGRMSTELASLGQLQQEQGQLLEEQLAEMREQQRLTRHLLTGDSHSTLASTPQGSPGALRPPTVYLERDLFEVIVMLEIANYRESSYSQAFSIILLKSRWVHV